MEIEIITKRDLEAFGQQLLHDLFDLLSQKHVEQEKPYLRSKEVRKLLGGISAATLQSLRVKGILKPTKIEGVFYYRMNEIKALLNGNHE
jgi:Helix-turn-helix domain